MTDRVDSLEAEEREVTEKIWPIVGPHINYLAGVFNLFVKFNLFFNDRLIRDIAPELAATLFLSARLANDVRGMQLVSVRGYGAQACSLAATIWELAWQTTLLCTDPKEARRWSDRERITEGGPDPEKGLRQYLKRKQHPNIEAQFQLEKLIYRKLCAMKHGNPFIHSMRPTVDWDRHGMLRQGPDASEFSQKAICFAAEVGGQLCELALSEAAEHQLAEGERLVFRQTLDESTNLRLNLQDQSKKRWSSFP